MRKGFLIYEEMRKYLVIYEEAVSHIRLCNCSLLNFLHMRKIYFLFYQCRIEYEIYHAVRRCANNPPIPSVPDPDIIGSPQQFGFNW
jgi:hypothetical protein